MGTLKRILVHLKSLRVQLAVLQVSGELSGNNTIQCKQKLNMNVRLGITL